jgi:hypothetical protein
MAMSCTITEERLGTVKKVKFVWVSAADGTASGTTTNAYTGEIIRLVTIPAAAGSAPADNYDVAVDDEDGADVLMGAGADRDTANTEQVLGSSLGCVANDKLALAVTNAGDTKGGTVILYIR